MTPASLRRLWPLAVIALLLILAVTAAPWLYGREKLAALTREPDQRFTEDNLRLVDARQPATLVIIGDSRVARWTPRPEQPETVIFRGVGGETTVQTMARLGADALALRPRIVLVLAGVNDLVAASYLPPADRAALVAATAMRLEAMAASVISAGSCVLIATIPPPARPDLLRSLVWRKGVVADVAAVNAKLRLGRLAPADLLDLAAVLPADAQGYLMPDYASDTLHLNDASYRIINEWLAGRLSEPSFRGRCRS